MRELLEGRNMGMVYGEHLNTVGAIYRLDSTLIQVVASIEHLNKAMVAFDKNLHTTAATILKALNRPHVGSVTFPGDALPDNIPDNKVGYLDKHNEGKAKPADRPSENSVLDSIDNFSELTEGMETLTDIFGKNSKMMQGLKKSFGVASKAAKVVSGAFRLGETISTGAAIVDGVIGAAELASGATLLAEIAAGPVGWGVALGTLAIGSMAEYMNQNAQEELRRKELIESDKRSNAALQTFRMSSKNADTYISNVSKIAEQVRITAPDSNKEWKLPNDPARDIERKYGPHAFEVLVPRTINAADNTQHRLNVKPGLEDHERDSYPVQKSYLQQSMPTYAYLMGTGLSGGRVGFEQGLMQRIAEAKSYDLKHKTHTVDQVMDVGRETASHLTRSANDGKKDPMNVTMPRRTGNSDRYGVSNGGKSVVININRPLIEHFSIHTGAASDGINEFKHKVEEVLLEILDSANAIN